MSLANLKPGIKAVIARFIDQDQLSGLSIRMMEMGLTVGSQIEVAYEAPFGGAIAVKCRGGLIALRTSDANLIEVEPLRRQGAQE